MSIDLRSDTVTLPTPDMLLSVIDSPLGDDVYDDDPTVNRLQIIAAQILGKQDALLVPTGTFGNLCSLLSHKPFGQQVVLSSKSHILNHEVGNFGSICKCIPYCIDEVDGMMPIQQIQNVLKRQKDLHSPQTCLLYLQNPTFLGKAIPLKYMARVRDLSVKYKVPMHIDGARLFNAAKALGVQPKQIVQYVDSVQICLSKGLCAPVGSLILGTRAFIEKAKYYRKMLGGGLRQAGVIAGPGIISLQKMRLRVDQDNKNAHDLAMQLKQQGYQTVVTDINMLFVTIPSKADFNKVNQFARQQGIKLGSWSEANRKMRLMTHKHIGTNQLEKVIKFFKLVKQM